VDVQRLSSDATVYSMTAFTEFGPGGFDEPNRPTLNFNLGSNPHMYLTVPSGGYALEDQSNYWWTAAMDHIEDNKAGQWAYRADVEYELDNSFVKSIAVGGRYTDRAYHTKQSTYNWGLLSAVYWGGGTPVYLNEDASPGLSSQSQLHTFDNFFHGNVPAPGVGWFPSPALLATGENAYDYLQATETAGWGWAPLTGYGPNDTADQYEKTKAGYALVRFGAEESSLGRFDGNIGVRVVETRYNTVSTFSVSGIRATPESCQTAHPGDPAACEAIQDAYAFLGADPSTNVPGSTITGPEFENKYTNVLPTLNLRFHLTDQLQLRFAAGKSMIRPDFHQTSPSFRLGWNFDNTGAVSAGLPPYVGTAASPGLKPMTSLQADTSIEYYWGKGNALTLALFYKNILDRHCRLAA
jgi:TonB-dependent receptor